jgi:hypothetical protein
MVGSFPCSFVSSCAPIRPIDLAGQDDHVSIVGRFEIRCNATAREKVRAGSADVAQNSKKGDGLSQV